MNHIHCVIYFLFHTSQACMSLVHLPVHAVSLVRRKPATHEHVKLPGELTHVCEQAVPVAHSSTSIGKDIHFCDGKKN